jgi:hypothetical protein
MAQTLQRPSADAESGPLAPIKGSVGVSMLGPHNVPLDRVHPGWRDAPSANAD